MHSAVQTAAVTIISYKPLSDLNFARYLQHYGSYMPSSPLGVYKPLVIQTINKYTCTSSVNEYLSKAAANTSR